MEAYYSVALLITTITFLAWVGYSDLRTSLIDVRVVIGFTLISAVLHLLFAYVLHTVVYLKYALAGGVLFLGLGYLIYFLSKWGEGDALVLGSLYFMYPYPFFMPLRYVVYSKVIYYWYVLFFNLSITGVIYSLLYAFVVSLSNKEFYRVLWKRIWNRNFFTWVLFTAMISLVIYITLGDLTAFILPVIFCFSYVTIIFAKLSDEILFTKKIPLTEVKEGDTIIGDFKKVNFNGKRLDAIDKQTLGKLIKAYGPNKKVVVKDMVRYLPSFLLGFLLTLALGDKIIIYLVSFLF